MKLVISNPSLALDIQVAVSTEETRHYLNGFHAENVDKGIVLVSTDGHRMLVINDEYGSLDGVAYPIRLPPWFLKEMKAC